MIDVIDRSAHNKSFNFRRHFQSKKSFLSIRWAEMMLSLHATIFFFLLRSIGQLKVFNFRDNLLSDWVNVLLKISGKKTKPEYHF